MSHESEQQKFDSVVKKTKMTREERSDFHRHLERNYKVEKDHLTYEQLLEIAIDFLDSRK